MQAHMAIGQQMTAPGDPELGKPLAPDATANEPQVPGSNGAAIVHVEAAEAPIQKSAHVGMLNKRWTQFFFGPFFKTIPAVTLNDRKRAKRARARDILKGQVDLNVGEEAAGEAAAASHDYIGALKRIVLEEVDTDGQYGCVNDELVPLPFDCPELWEYVLEFVSGTYLVAQATVVMFIAVLVDNDERGYKLGDNYTSRWLPIIKALIIVYPLVTLIVMTMLTCEYLFRKYMYYRMLSLRILVDWENRMIWQGIFFYYFVGTWILLNVWSLYGVVKMWHNSSGARSGADTVPFATWIVVNLQTLQLLLYYYRIITSELRLVALNQIFERAPVEAQMLLTYTYIVEEEVLIRECHAFGHTAVSAIVRRLGNILTCGMYFDEWDDVAKHAKFDLDRIKARADNYDAVEEAVDKLREELMEEMEEEERANLGRRSTAAARERRNSTSSPTAAGYPKIAAVKSADQELEPPVVTPPPVYPAVPAIGGTGAGGASPIVLNPLSDSGPESPGAGDGTARASPRTGSTPATKAALAQQVADHAWTDKADLPFLERVGRRFALGLYHRFYGSIHGLYISLLVHFPTWPYRGDVAYFRALMVMQLIGIMSVGAIVVFGVLRATSSNRCKQGELRCDSCAEFIDIYNGTCPMKYSLTQRLFGTTN